MHAISQPPRAHDGVNANKRSSKYCQDLLPNSTTAMSRRNNSGPSKGQFSRGLQYQETHVPKFLQQLRQQVNGGASGHRRTDDDDEDSPNVVSRRSASPPSRGGREAIPERPREGKWAVGSDDEEDGKKRRTRNGAEEEEDEWTQRYGGGDDAPQIVVLNEGKHLSAEEVRRAKTGEPRGSCRRCAAKFCSTDPLFHQDPVQIQNPSTT